MGPNLQLVDIHHRTTEIHTDRNARRTFHSLSL